MTLSTLVAETVLTHKAEGHRIVPEAIETIKHVLRGADEVQATTASTLAFRLIEAFPEVWDQVQDEDSCDRCAVRDPYISVDHSTTLGYVGLCGGCFDILSEARA